MADRPSAILCALLLALPLAAENALTAAPDDFDEKVEFYDTVVASVNGEPIVLSEVVMESQQEEARLFATLTGQELEDAVVKQRRNVVDKLINRRLVRAEFDPSEYQIDNQVLESAMDDWSLSLNCKTRVDLERWARRNHTSIAEMRRKMLDYLIEQYILFKHFTITVNITPKDTYEYFNAHVSELSQAESLHLGVIYLANSRPEVEALAEEISGILAADPDRFFELAAEYTDGPFKARSGDLGWLERPQLRELFSDALGEEPQAGIITPPIAAPEGVYFLKVLEYTPAQPAVYQEVEQTLRERLEEAARAKAYEEYIKTLRAKAVIRYY